MPDSNMVIDSEKGGKFISTIDPDDPDYQKSLLRPAAVKEDVILMSQKQRVSLVLKSDPFRRELEEIIRSQSQSGEYPGMNASLLSLQHVSDLFTSATGGYGSSGLVLSKGQHGGIIPINDLRGGDAIMYSRRERSLRCKLAAVYRLIDLFGWNTGIHNHITARISSKNEHFLVNPFGLLYHEITASSLIKVDSKGQVLDTGSTVLGLNQATWLLHSAVHSARADIRCVVHVDTPATIAVSCMKSGLFPLCHEAMILGEIAYHTPSSVFTGLENGYHISDSEHDKLRDWTAERSAIAEALGPTARVLFLRSRGLLALGETVEEAWHYASNAVAACETQLLIASLGSEHLVLPTEKLKQKTFDTWRTAGLGGLSGPEAALAMRLTSTSRSSGGEQSSPNDGTAVNGDGGTTYVRPWRLGELEFEAMMRHLDNAGYRTGHLYRQEAMASPHRTRRAKTLDGLGYSSQNDDIRVPPTASSVTTTMNYYYDDGVFSGDETETPRPSTLGRTWSQRRWFNTPNKYTKELIRPTPAHQPVPHWVSDRESAIRRVVSGGGLPPPAPFHPLTPGAVPLGTTGGPATGTALVGSPYDVFAPQGPNPKEYKDQQRKVKDKYYHDTNTAGPQSRLLDGLTWDEARRVRDEGLMKALGPKVAALVSQGVSELPVAAASKGIIQRDIRNAAVIYDGLYSHQNPFEKITDEELEMYRREIELKNNPQLAAELERRGFVTIDKEHALTPTAVDSLAVDSGATDLESASDAGPGSRTVPKSPSDWSPPLFDRELKTTHVRRTQTLPAEAVVTARLSPPAATSTLTSELSAAEDLSESQAKQKKKRRFKLPTFSLSRSKDKGK